jgi:hypothetical protein
VGIKYTNNAEGTLADSINDSDTGLESAAPSANVVMTSGDGLLFPIITAGNYFYATLVDVSGNVEIIKVVLHNNGSNEFQSYERAQDGTIARAFAIGDKVQLRIPKVVIEELQDLIDANTALQHAQNTDTGTDETDFQIDSGNSGPNIKNNSGVLEVRNAADDAYALLKALGLELTAALSVATTAAIVGIATFTAAAVFTNGLSSGGTIVAEAALTVGTTLGVTGASTMANITSSGTFKGTIENESVDKKMLARDHATPATPEVPNLVYGTGSPPTASNTPIGTIFIKYTA